MPSMQVGFNGSGLRTTGSTLLEEMKLLEEVHGQPGGGGGGGGGRKAINSELWHACAGPLVSLPQPGSLVYYFPQGHTEQVTTTTKRVADGHIPCYPNLSSQMICQVHKVTLHADKDTDEMYAQITLQPVNSDNDVFSIPDFGQSYSKQPKEFFCKTLTASDTSTHGGFSVPRRAAEKLFPPLDYSMQPPNQEIIVKDLHDNTWTFRHIYRGQPKRHLLTTGWSVFVGSKRLKAGDSVLFIRDERSQLLLGVRRANRQQTALPSSVLSADSMHIGVLAAAAHASANRTPFTIYYNPRACPSEFVVPLAKYHRAVYGTRISIGMRFGMMFEAEDSSKRRHMGTIMGISDIDPLRWPNSKWRNLQVEWDEHACIERPSRVSLWGIETPENLFILSSTSVLKRPSNSDLTEEEGKNVMKRSFQQVPEPGDVIKALLKPRIPNPGFQVGCYPSIYTPLVQRITKYESPITSTILGCFNQGNHLLHDILCQSESQKESISFPQQQVTTPQCHLEENSNVSNCQTIVSDLNSHVHRRQDVLIDVLPEPKHDSYDDSFESKNNSSGREGKDVGSQRDCANVASAKTSIDVHENTDAMTAPVSELQSNSGQDFGEKRNCPAITDPSLLLERGFQIQEKLDPNVVQSAQEDAPLSDTTGPIFPLHDKHHQPQHNSCYMDNLGWMLHPSFGQSFTQEEQMQPESLSSFGKVDMTSFHGSDNSRTTSADISAIINPERFSSTCTSENSSDQYLLRFAQDSLGGEMASYLTIPSFLEEQPQNFLEQCASRPMPSEVHSVSIKEINSRQDFPQAHEVKGFLECDDTPSEMFSLLHFQVSNGNILSTQSIMNKSEDRFNDVRSSSLCVPTKGFACNFKSCQDVQSQVNSSLTDFSQELPDNSGGTSMCNMDAGENSQLNKSSWKQVSPPRRTYTKVQKLGSVGRCIDVTRFRNYDELVSAIACMFGLEDQLNDPRGSEWKLVYVDYENDILLVGDDPWEEFVNCVWCIRILSRTEVQQMSQEGLPIIDDPGDVGAYHTEQNPFLDEGYMLCRGST